MKTTTKVETKNTSRAPVNENIKRIEILWTLEAESRLRAYRNGELQSVDLKQVLTKYK